MRGRPLLLDLRSRNNWICRSCLHSIQWQAAQPWMAAYSSQATRKATLTPTPQPHIHGSVARPPSAAELKQYLNGIQELQGAKREEEGGGEESFTVRYFEQDGEKRTELPDEQAFGDSFYGLARSEGLKDVLSGIKDALHTNEDKDAFEAFIHEMGGSVDGTASPDDLQKMMARMEASAESIDADIERACADLPKELGDELQEEMSKLPFMRQSTRLQVPTPQIPEKPWTLNQRKKISRLNTVLARVSREIHREPRLTKKSVSSVYKAYHAARLPLAHGWSHVPTDVWDLVWTVFSADESINIHRMAHIALLARDMGEAKVTLSPSRQLLTIEAVFVDGWESKAIESWKRCMSALGDEESEKFQEFWELGVRMFCRVGDVVQAERAVNKLVAKQMDARILIPLIRTYSEQSSLESQEKAWAAYRQMRGLLGRDMKLSDYDLVVSYFLTANQTENALYAFVDMMSDGKIDLKRQKYMPSVVANKFFFGKWLKRLIGAGDLDGALRVVVFMGTKGIEASPIQLNGLIGAWQRSGGAADLEKADRMAWDMVESRIRFVRDRRGGDGPKACTKSTTAPVPRATLETFCLLAENYRLRNLHGKMEALWDAFRDAKISPDAFMMNQLLESHIQEGQPREALALYRSLVAERGVTPDPYTFSALWKTLAVNRLQIVPPEALEQETDATRRLFEETVKFKSVFEPDGMDVQLARKILHTFRLLRDKAGFLVALTTLRDVFKFLPPEALAMELVLDTTKLSLDTAWQRSRLLHAKRDMDRELLAWAEGDVEKVEGQKRGEALHALLQRRYWPGGDAAGDGGKLLDEAAKQMGVYELLTPGGRGL